MYKLQTIASNRWHFLTSNVRTRYLHHDLPEHYVTVLHKRKQGDRSHCEFRYPGKQRICGFVKGSFLRQHGARFFMRLTRTHPLVVKHGSFPAHPPVSYLTLMKMQQLNFNGD